MLLSTPTCLARSVCLVVMSTPAKDHGLVTSLKLMNGSFDSSSFSMVMLDLDRGQA